MTRNSSYEIFEYLRFGRMDSTMFIEISFLSELLPTTAAIIRFFSIVHPHVVNKVPALVEFLISIFVLAYEISNGPVCSLVMFINSDVLIAI